MGRIGSSLEVSRDNSPVVLTHRLKVAQLGKPRNSRRVVKFVRRPNQKAALADSCTLGSPDGIGDDLDSWLPIKGVARDCHFHPDRQHLHE